jgi:dimethylargininase
MGLEIVLLEALEDYPDGYFVEDTAVIMPEMAVISRPGAATRQGEISQIEPVLSRFRPISHILSPGTLDGGDVLMVKDHFFVGLSERTNAQGAAQFGRIVEDLGYTWRPVTVSSGLHLKSSVNYVGKNTLLLTAEYATRQEFQGFDHIILPDEELLAANTLLLNGALIMPTGFPQTRELLTSLGPEIFEIDVSEARKMDGGLTCMSLRF